MILPDVSVLVYAHREDAVDHTRYKQWLEAVLKDSQPYGMSDHVLSGFLRVVTHPRVFTTPSPTRAALEFVQQVRGQPNCRMIAPGSRHWQIFTGLCQSHSATGNLVPDVWFAALAIESDCDYEQFPDLRRRHPFNGKAAG